MYTVAVASTTRILGIDPGSQLLGVGCIAKSGNRLKYLHGETIAAPRGLSFFDRLEILSEQLRLRVEQLRPDVLAIEDTFFARNAKSAFRLGIARGVAISACLGRGMPIFEYAPTQVKSVVTGYGRADKDQVRKMVRLSVRCPEELGFDATDAIAVAICHAHSFQGKVKGHVGIRPGQDSLQDS